MTVNELIEELSKVDGTLEVGYFDWTHGYLPITVTNIYPDCQKGYPLPNPDGQFVALEYE